MFLFYNDEPFKLERFGRATQKFKKGFKKIVSRDFSINVLVTEQFHTSNDVRIWETGLETVVFKYRKAVYWMLHQLSTFLEKSIRSLSI